MSVFHSIAAHSMPFYSLLLESPCSPVLSPVVNPCYHGKNDVIHNSTLDEIYFSHGRLHHLSGGGYRRYRGPASPWRTWCCRQVLQGRPHHQDVHRRRRLNRSRDCHSPPVMAITPPSRPPTSSSPWVLLVLRSSTEASDIILMDADSVASIVKAIMWGSCVNDVLFVSPYGSRSRPTSPRSSSLLCLPSLQIRRCPS